MHNDVVEHIFYVWGNCVRKRREGYTLLYYTRASKGVKREWKEKDEKENYKKIDIRKKQEDLESTVRILFLSGLTVDYSIGIDRINTEWVLIRF